MKFAHMADCHIGGLRDPRLKEAGIRSFVVAIERCIEENVDFIIIAGDLFNTAMPGIDCLKVVTASFRRVYEHDIPVYLVCGSHDFSPSGKTMIDVLEEAHLIKNLFRGEVREGKLFLKFTEDKKTKVKMVGMLGKRGSLERSYYDGLELNHLEKEEGFKIFVFHMLLLKILLVVGL